MTDNNIQGEQMINYAMVGSLQEQFSRQAKLHKNDIAVVDNLGSRVTYGELDKWTDKLAEVLRQKGLVSNKCAAIYMEKCLQYIVAYIAILKAGGAYLPIDTSYPSRLVMDVLDEAEPVIVFTTGHKDDIIKQSSSSVQIIAMKDTAWKSWLEGLTESSDFTKPDSFDDLAFIVYSSGTTGKPKGIAVPQRSPVFCFNWAQCHYPFGDNEREACNVFFVWQLMRPLLEGKTLCIIPEDVIYDPKRLLAYLQTNKITRMLFTPSLLEAVLDQDEDFIKESMASMRMIWLCGEVVLVKLLERCLTLCPWILVVNLYSISECHDVAACNLTEYYHNVVEKEGTKSKFCPVGQLLPGVEVFIWDLENNLAKPVGVPGEIFVSGPTLAVGYLKRPELNLARFLPLPSTLITPGSKHSGSMYRTGDWGYLLGDRTLEICGRCDSMVKIRGYSVELAAVESALLSLLSVRACLVLSHGEEGTDKALVAYIVPETTGGQGVLNRRELRAALKRRIPFYMIPGYFIFLNEIPLVAATGKLDKAALPPLNRNESSVEAECLPQTDIECRLATLWSQVLGIKEIDIQESFFDLGGHSLLATKLLNLVNDEFSSNLTVKDLFQFPSLSNMADLLKPRDHSPEPDMPIIDLIKEVDNHDQNVNLDIQLRAFWRHSEYNEKRWMTGCVLLTGATGFLGSFVLRDLLMLTNVSVFCLVRESSSESPDARIRRVLAEYGLLADKDTKKPTEEQLCLENKFNEHVTIVKGDISLVRFGLSEADYSYFCTEIDFIIHTAAYVNLVYPYHALYTPNVLGTQNLLLFSAQGKIKPVHYASTDAVFPEDSGETLWREDSRMDQGLHTRLTSGYSQSKWVAEQLVLRAMRRGHPAVVYRMGNLSGDSQHAGWNTSDFNLLMLRAIADLGYGPDVPAWRIEMTPVDFTSRVIVRMAGNISRCSGRIFHLINSKPLASNLLYEWMNIHGYVVKKVPFDEFVNVVQTSKLTVAPQLFRLLQDMVTTASFFSRAACLDNTQTLTALADLGHLSYPSLDSSLLTLYFNHLATRKWIRPPRRTTLSNYETQLLADRVAIVTGASSGIGQAIAIQLAEAGCCVALVGRKADQLNRTRAAIESLGGRALVTPADVTLREEMEKVVNTTEVALGPIDIIVNCAGVMYYTLMANTKFDQWMQQIDVNCKGVVNGVGVTLPGMLQRGQGHIINVSSDAGRKPFPGLAVYTGTKYFVEGFSQATRLEIARTGVRVTCIQPGDVRTPLQHMSTDKQAVEQFSGDSSIKMLEAEDIARAVVYAAVQPQHVAVNEILIEPRDCPT